MTPRFVNLVKSAIWFIREYCPDEQGVVGRTLMDGESLASDLETEIGEDVSHDFCLK